MTQEMSLSGRSIVALVRVDGHGELRDDNRVIRMHASNPDELRGQLMERAIAIAVDEDREISLKTIDVDGIYQLVCHPNGNLEQVGDVLPLGPGDTELTPQVDSKASDGGYAQLFGNEEDAEEATTDSLHETIQLPREAMMAKHFEVEERGPLDEDIEDEPIHAAGLFAEPSAAADADEDLDDEFHDEGLDQDFADEEDAPAVPSPASPTDGTKGDQPDTDALDVSETPADEWQPQFTRGNRRAPQSPPSLAASEQAAAKLAAAQPGAAQDRQPMPALPEVAPVSPSMPQNHPGAGMPVDADDDDLLSGPSRPRRVAVPPAHSSVHDNVPTLDDFLASKQSNQARLAEHGWRAKVRRASGGLIKLGPGKQERTVREEMDTIQKVFDGTRTIVVVNPKGGAHKTTATLMIAAAFGTMRGGYTLAWDNNETRGTLGWRSRTGVTANTAVDLLRELPHFEISGGATISDIDRYVRNQGDAKFDVLASDDDAASAAIIDDDAFSRLHRVLSRFYRIMVIDTGNNMRASNWEAALNVADQLVIVSTAREDTAASAAWLADGLRERGYGELLANAVTVLSSPSAKEDPVLADKLHSHFEKLTRAVVSVPYDQEFVGGGELNIPNLQPATREAWRHAAAVIAQGL